MQFADAPARRTQRDQQRHENHSMAVSNAQPGAYPTMRPKCSTARRDQQDRQHFKKLLSASGSPADGRVGIKKPPPLVPSCLIESGWRRSQRHGLLRERMDFVTALPLASLSAVPLASSAHIHGDRLQQRTVRYGQSSARRPGTPARWPVVAKVAADVEVAAHEIRPEIAIRGFAAHETADHGISTDMPVAAEKKFWTPGRASGEIAHRALAPYPASWYW